MEVLIEKLAIYGFAGSLIFVIMFIYLRKKDKISEEVEKKIEKAKEFGLHEPVSLHPVIDLNKCIGSGACISACPEQDILGWRRGKGATINASRCVGHGACFHSCPVEAITLVIGTEKRGVELPHVSQNYETNVPGIYIAGELGGMGLIKNAVRQGVMAVENILKSKKLTKENDYQVTIIGAGPAGIAASLTCKKNKVKFITLDQDTLGGTVASFPRAKIVMTSPMELPLYGKVKLVETTKTELLTLWNDVLTKNDIKINESEKVNEIVKVNNHFRVTTSKKEFTTDCVILAIGRRGTPRKLGVPGEEKEKVYYRLLEPELIHNKNILVVGGGDSAVESAMLLADEENKVTLSYRSDSFKRIKPKNLERITSYQREGKITIIYNSNVKEILDDKVILKLQDEEISLENDLVYVFAGGELPNQFLKNIGIEITKKYGEAVLKH